jgi:cytochrome c peroxidase
LGILIVSAAVASAAELTAKQRLGKSIFFDKSLSLRQNQSCAACHSADTGFTGPDSGVNAQGSVYEGSIAGRFGNRKPPAAAYATPSPILHVENDGTFTKPEWLFVGGNFWDGRATGYKLGNPAADQALGPFLNPVEQALPDEACVVYRVCKADYPVPFQSVWGSAPCNISWPDNVERACAAPTGKVTLKVIDRFKVNVAFSMIGLTIAEYEASPEVNQYTSKYDYYLKGRAALTATERLGLDLFNGKAKCALCHVLDPGPNQGPPLLTDFTYDNLGVPKNPANPAGPAWVDKGLGGFLEGTLLYRRLASENMGKQKVPTLRNVDKRPSPSFVKAYTHNGYFKTLKGIVHFYNTRDVKPTCPNPLTSEADALRMGCWPAPEVAANVNTDELGNLLLTPAEEDAVVEFMKTLSDGYQPGR